MNKDSKLFYEPNSSTAMMLSLRRTLVRSTLYAAREIMNIIELDF